MQQAQANEQEIVQETSTKKLTEAAPSIIAMNRRTQQDQQEDQEQDQQQTITTLRPSSETKKIKKPIAAIPTAADDAALLEEMDLPFCFHVAATTL